MAIITMALRFSFKCLSSQVFLTVLEYYVRVNLTFNRDLERDHSYESKLEILPKNPLKNDLIHFCYRLIPIQNSINFSCLTIYFGVSGRV